MTIPQSAKGNPASKRMVNARLKARRKECWQRGQARKAKRVESNWKLHRERAANGGLGRRERRRIAAGIRTA